MGLLDKLRQSSNYLLKLRSSLGPDSYFNYKQRRKYDRQEADHAREDAKDSAQRKREDAARSREKTERERGYDERYAHEREGDVAREPTERAEKMEPDR